MALAVINPRLQNIADHQTKPRIILHKLSKVVEKTTFTKVPGTTKEVLTNGGVAFTF